MDLVFKDTFDSKYKGKYLTGPKCDLNYTVTVDIPSTPEGKSLVKDVEKLFTAKMADFRKAKEKEFADATKGTEDDFLKKKVDGAKLKEWVDTCNIMLKKGVEALETQVQKLAETVYKKAIDEINKKAKNKILVAKVKAGLKIALFVGIIVLAAAASIAATVLSGGVAAIVIIGAIGTGLGAAKKIYDAIDKEWPTQKKSIKNLNAALSAYQEAVAYVEKKELKTQKGLDLGPKERLKLFFAGTETKKKEVIKQLELCQAFIDVTRGQLIKMQQNADKLAADITKMKEVKDPAQAKLVAEMEKSYKMLTGKIEYTRETTLKSHAATLKTIEELMAKEMQDSSDFGEFAMKLKAIHDSDSFQTLKDSLKLLYDGAKKLEKALG